MSETFVESSFNQLDPSFEVPLRPQTLQEFRGQAGVCERLDVMIRAAKERGEAVGHCLFSGPPGLGKTTLANIVANTMGTELTVTSGPVLGKPGDLAGVLTNLKKGDVLFIDEIHRMPRAVEEYLYTAMEDWQLDLVIDSGPNARTVQVKLNTFTLVGATTRVGLLSAPLRTRFGNVLRLDFYDLGTLVTILQRTGRLLNLELPKESAEEIARRARGTPRIANHLLRWVRDFAQIHAGNRVELTVVRRALALLNIDSRGLDEVDQKILSIIIDYYGGGPVGLQTLAAAIGEESDTIEDVHEPYLIQEGLLTRGPRGREVTPLAYEHLKEINHVE
ncbi:MAG: Holliday junction branch migration DNA helicase RuvB [Chlamydiia bacterium]|nr:Holliday junction branch migration DNA helicase RuvB [Chlamydiia bacterium]